MATLEEELRTKLTAAIKARDLRIANIIRMVNTKVMERRTTKGFAGNVDDELYREVINSYKKSLEKAIKEFEPAGDRARDQIAELNYEIEYLSQYLPQMMSEEQVRASVRATIAALGVTNPKQSGKVMGAAMKELKGKAEPELVKKIVGEELK